MDAEDTSPAGSHVNWRTLTLFLLTITILLGCALILRPFLPAITGAVVLAIVTQRPYDWIASKVKNGGIAAIIGVVLVALSLVGPAIFLIRSVGYQVALAVGAFQNGAVEQGLQNFLDQYPRIADLLQYSQDNFNLAAAIGKSTGFVAQRLAMILGGSIAAATQVVIMMFLLFFLYRDRKQVLSYIRSIVPLNQGETNHLFLTVNDTVLATVVGRFLVAAIQGLVAGLTFFALGVSGASLLGILTALLAIVPPLGAFVVWLPVAIYLAVTHHWVQAIILAAIGSLIISTLDNFIYPILVGTRIRMHTVPIFLSILGGIWFFGVEGLILGPIVFAIAQSLLEIWHRRIDPEAPVSGEALG